MKNECKNCKTFLKEKFINLICPVNENYFGLEKNLFCRKKVLQLLLKFNMDQTNVKFTNSKILKTYNSNIIKKYYENYKFFTNKFIKLKIKRKLKLSEEEYESLLYNPIEILNFDTEIKDKISKIVSSSKNSFLKEIIIYQDMEYDEKYIYTRIFEPDITFDERWFSNLRNIKEMIDEIAYSIKLLELNKNFYFVKIKGKNITEQKSKFHLLEKMSGLSNNLKRLIVLFLDQQIQEIYLDKEEDWIYIDHEVYGRCNTNVFLNCVDVEKFKTYVSIITGEEITLSNPSLKTSIIDENVKLRIAIDTFPIVENTSLDIRKFKLKMLSLKDLIRLGSLNLDLAAFLIYCLLKRCNMIICGEPNSGKTTLANALAQYLPDIWRKIYIEDVDELYSSALKIPHKVFIKTSSIDVMQKYSTKSVEIIKLLHRSPDWIFLGEIQTKEHAKAMFHALLAGLKGLMTCHSSNVKELLNRWILQHNIHPSNILVLDLIICMQRKISNNGILRWVKEVYEITNKEKKVKLNKIYDYKENKFELNEKKITKINLIRKIAKEENKTFEEILHEIILIKNLRIK